VITLERAGADLAVSVPPAEALAAAACSSPGPNRPGTPCSSRRCGPQGCWTADVLPVSAGSAR